MNRKSNVHPPYNKFKGWLREHNITYADVGKVIGRDEVTVCSKINGQSDFLLNEIKILKKKYHLDSDIFFENPVA